MVDQVTEDRFRDGPGPGAANGPPGVAELVDGIIKDMQRLTRQQLALFKQEIADDFRKARGIAIAWVLGLGAIAIAAIIFAVAVAQLLFWAWGATLPLWACYGIVAVATAVIGASLVYMGQKELESLHVVPEQSLQALKENVQCLTNPK